MNLSEAKRARVLAMRNAVRAVRADPPKPMAETPIVKLVKSVIKRTTPVKRRAK